MPPPKTYRGRQSGIIATRIIADRDAAGAESVTFSQIIFRFHFGVQPMYPERLWLSAHRVRLQSYIQRTRGRLVGILAYPHFLVKYLKILYRFTIILCCTISKTSNNNFWNIWK